MKRIILAGAVILVAVAGWPFAKACAPDFFRAVFSYVRHPDLPRTEFIEGRLGVLQPTFARSYLVIAYRYLNGIGLSPREREQVRGYYKDRQTRSWDHTGTDWPARWRSVRAQVAVPPPPRTKLITGGQLAYNPETHTFALNCAEDAFRVAVHTLESRRSRFGAGSRAFRSWVDAQDLVFKNCDGDKPEIPHEASGTDLPPLIRADRDYQIAAAHFYAGDYDAALERFRRISRDTSSPWNMISRYPVVRTLLRMTDDPKAAVQTGAQLQADSQAILSDRALAPIHGMTWNLSERAGIRQRDQVYFRELARLLSSKGQDDGLREELWNYTDMYDHLIGEGDPNAVFGPSKTATVDVSRFRDLDLTDWIFNFQWRDASVFNHCVSRWRETHSPAWLLAAVSHTNAAGAQNAGLLHALAAIPNNSPAYLTARFHLLRIYEELGDRRMARDGLDDLLAGSALKGLPSSINLFRGLRMLTATTFDDFVRFATRKPVMITLQVNLGEVPGFYYEEQTENRPKPTELFDLDATRVLNRATPFRLLKRAALEASLPPELKNEALMTAFTRGLMLGEDLSEIAKELGTAEPGIAAHTTEYLNESSDERRRFAAAFLLLHRPEARPYFASGITRQSRPGKLDPYRDNWWCPTDVQMELDSRANTTSRWYMATPNLLQRSAADDMPEFLGGNASTEATQEMDKLGKLSAATDFLGGIVLFYAKAHPGDTRIPEALYWPVRAGHYGCADTNTWKTTREAFRVLQLRYPKTSWAKRTPTWFRNDFDIRQEINARESER
ncbi:MAG: hypothetical protein U0Q18_22215 [Bryobacteraceae bacterium]